MRLTFNSIICWNNISIYLCTKKIHWSNRLIGPVGRVFANGRGDLGSIPGRVIPKTLKMILDTSLLNTHQYKVRIKDKVEESRERSSALPNTSVLKKEPSGRPLLQSPTLLIYGIKMVAKNKNEPETLI